MLAPNQLAKALAAAATVTASYRVVAIGMKGKSIAFATNSQKTHSKGKRIRKNGQVTCSSHAEIRLLTKMQNPDCVFVLRLRRDGKLALAKPCELCQVLLKDVGHVMYTDSQGIFRQLKG